MLPAGAAAGHPQPAFNISATIPGADHPDEESGTFGSIDYVENTIPPGEEGKAV